MKKLLIICGPTATGKTGLGLKLAKKFKGEVISADSRQVYKGMDIATGKDIIQGEWEKDHWELRGIPLWLLDIVNPNEEFSVAHFTDLAWKKIKDIWKRGKLPILVGGTGFYIKAIIEDIPTKNIPPNWSFRKKLELKSKEALFKELAELDSSRAGKMNISDRQNKRRLIRAIEIARWRIGFRSVKTTPPIQFEHLIIGLKAPLKFLYQKIDRRIEEQFKDGAEKEVKRLIERGFSWDLPSMSAMGYREWRLYFEGKATLNEVITRWKFNEHSYARRQMTWFKKMPEIHWFDIAFKEWQDEIEKMVNKWYN